MRPPLLSDFSTTAPPLPNLRGLPLSERTPVSDEDRDGAVVDGNREAFHCELRSPLEGVDYRSRRPDSYNRPDLYPLATAAGAF